MKPRRKWQNPSPAKRRNPAARHAARLLRRGCFRLSW